MDRAVIRPAHTADVVMLWQALAMAAYEESVDAVKAVPPVALHLKGWRRPQDFGFLALDPGGGFLGAAWARQFTAAEEPLVFLGATTPEVSIAVVPEARGQGLGRRLLQALVSEAGARGVDLCLNVRETNPAFRLYRSVGFQRIPGSVFANRTGGLSYGMTWRASAASLNSSSRV